MKYAIYNLQLLDNPSKFLAAMELIAKHPEAGAARRKYHHVSWRR